MELDQLLQRFLHQECTHHDVLDVVVPVVHHEADLSNIHSVDSCIVESFPFFFRNGKSIEYASERFSMIPNGTLIHAIYTIEEVLEHSHCFFRYRVSVGEKKYLLCLLKPDFWNRDYEEAFLRESTISQVLSEVSTKCLHACTVSMIPFLVYDTPQGGTIKDYLLRQPIPDLAVLRRIGLQVCTAICSLHQVLMSHLGIRMEIFGVSKVGMFLRDFGVEERLKPQIHDVHRIRYYAPEQFSDGYLDARTDVYALGILLYRLYNGQFPFPDKNKDLIEWHLSGDRQQIPFLDSVHPDVQEVILKSIHPEPMLRYDTACQLKDAFCHATSKIGWFIFDRQLLPKIKNRICKSHLYCNDTILEWNGALEDEFGDVYPTWRLYGGELLLSIDPFLNEENSTYVVEDIKQSPFIYSKFKVLHDLGFRKECLEQCEHLEKEIEHLLLLIHVYSSLFSNPKKTEELLSILMTATKSFTELLDVAVFSCWHRLDEVTTKKILKQLEELCSSSHERILLAQSYVSLLNDEESSSRHLHMYIQSCSDDNFEKQIEALSEAAICFGQRPELVRWAIRLEETCQIGQYVVLVDVWNVLGLPKRAQKMKQKRTEALRLSVQQMMQKFATFSLPIPKVSTTDLEDMMSFLKDGERLVALAQRKHNLHKLIAQKGVPMNIETIPLEEEALFAAEDFCENFVGDEDALEEETTEVVSSKKVQEPESFDTIEETSQEENLPSKIGFLTLQLTILWGVVLTAGLTLWYSCA